MGFWSGLWKACGPSGCWSIPSDCTVPSNFTIGATTFNAGQALPSCGALNAVRGFSVTSTVLGWLHVGGAFVQPFSSTAIKEGHFHIVGMITTGFKTVGAISYGSFASSLGGGSWSTGFNCAIAAAVLHAIGVFTHMFLAKDGVCDSCPSCGCKSCLGDCCPGIGCLCP